MRSRFNPFVKFFPKVYFPRRNAYYQRGNEVREMANNQNNQNQNRKQNDPTNRKNQQDPENKKKDAPESRKAPESKF